jgi:hypothetical protein
MILLTIWPSAPLTWVWVCRTESRRRCCRWRETRPFSANLLQVQVPLCTAGNPGCPGTPDFASPCTVNCFLRSSRCAGLSETRRVLSKLRHRGELMLPLKHTTHWPIFQNPRCKQQPSRIRSGPGASAERLKAVGPADEVAGDDARTCAVCEHLRGFVTRATWLGESAHISRAGGELLWILVLGRFACHFSRKWHAGPFFGARAGAGAPAYKPSSVLSP